MGKLTQLLAVLAVAAVPVFAAPAVSAVDCTIENTGQGSQNECTTQNTYTCELTNENQVVVRNENDQNGQSGSGTVVDNTNGGGAYSGSVTNENGTKFNVTIDNGECVVTSVVTPQAPEQPKPTPTPTPAQPVQPTSPAQPTELANTAGDSTTRTVLGILGGSALISGVVYAVSMLKNRYNQ